MNKIKRIKYLIEQLNISDLKELNTLLEIPFTSMKYPKANVFSPYVLAKRIEDGEIEETDEFLKIQDKDGISTAHLLAIHSGETGWYTYDKKILRIQDRHGDSVAHILADKSNITNWQTQDKEVLMLQDNRGWSVAHILAVENKEWYATDKGVLYLKLKNGDTVEKILMKRYLN